MRRAYLTLEAKYMIMRPKTANIRQLPDFLR